MKKILIITMLIILFIMFVLSFFNVITNKNVISLMFLGNMVLLIIVLFEKSKTKK